MIRNDQVYIEHILEAITKIENFTKGVTRLDFDQNVMIKDAMNLNL